MRKLITHGGLKNISGTKGEFKGQFAVDAGVAALAPILDAVIMRVPTVRSVAC
jgi:hypothetical protein